MNDHPAGGSAHAITRPLGDLAAWTACLRTADIPVMEDTALALEALRAVEDSSDANSLGEMISNDPLMTLKVLACAAGRRSSRCVTDIKTVTGALVMMGITPFFTAFGPQPTIEARLADKPEALLSLRQTLQRAHRGANFALGFAVHRRDPEAPVIHASVLLHDFAELLIWCHAPALALQLQDRQRTDPSLPAQVAQRSVLNIELADLQQALIQAWHLPELMTRIRDIRHAGQANVQCAILATQLARHTASGWDNPEVCADLAQIATLLNLSPAAALEYVQEL